MGTNRSDFVKATLQSIAYQTRDIIETMRQDTEMPVVEILADGETTAEPLFDAVQADILNLPIVRSAMRKPRRWGQQFVLVSQLATGKT